MDITKFIRDKVIQAYIGSPITLDLHIDNLSEKYDVGVLLTISVIPKTKKEER